MGEGLWVIVLLVAAGLIALSIALSVLFAGVLGALLLFTFAAEFGFIGVVAYIVCWVIFFPVMLIVSIVLGFLNMWAERAESE